MRHGRTRIITVSAAVALLSLVGCSGGPSQPASDASSPGSVAASPDSATPGPTTPAPSAVESTDPGPRFSRDKQQDEGFPNLDSAVLPTAVRQAEHDGYTRVVIDLSGAGTPHYSAEYVDVPTADGSGDPITMRGTAFLQVTLSGVRTPEEQDERAPLSTDGVNSVDEVYVGGPFEGVARVIVGVGSKSPFRVFTLEAPSRLVIDVQTI